MLIGVPRDLNKRKTDILSSTPSLTQASTERQGTLACIGLLQSCIIMKWLAKCQSEERQLGTWMVLPFMSKNGSFGSLSSPLKLSHKKCIWKWFSCMIKTSSFTIEKKKKTCQRWKFLVMSWLKIDKRESLKAQQFIWCVWLKYIPNSCWAYQGS